MQVTDDEAAVLARRIDAAFADVPIPADRNEILGEIYRSSEYPGLMANAFVGRHWSTIPVEVLHYHRDDMGALGPIGFRAYLPAYLKAWLVNDEYGRSLGIFVGVNLYGHGDELSNEAAVRERLSLLDHEQCAVVRDVVRYIAEVLDHPCAEAAWRDWETHDYFPDGSERSP